MYCTVLYFLTRELLVNIVKLVKSGLAHEDQYDKKLELRIITWLILIVQIPVHVSVIFESQLVSLPKHLRFGVMLILSSKDIMEKMFSIKWPLLPDLTYRIWGKKQLN